MQMTLRNVAHVRSGDKGNTACISVIAFSPELYAVLQEQLSAEQFKAFYKGVITGAVTRYEAPGLDALQFVADGALGGGVSRSLCLDNYGKALCSAILAYPIEVPERLQNQVRGL
ncbi:MAG: AtuA-related protein [Janthinobacterium lividum]